MEGTFNIRLDREIRKKLDDLAKSMRRSRSSVIRILIEDIWNLEKDK